MIPVMDGIEAKVDIASNSDQVWSYDNDRYPDIMPRKIGY
jgi:hypothetical protein